jgi:hypothetical protein
MNTVHSKSTKKSRNQTTSSHAATAASTSNPVGTAPPTTPPGDLPPAARAPSTPADWKASAVKGRGKTRGQRVTKEQAENATAAAGELSGSTTFADDFGARAPSPLVMGFLLSNAATWRTIWDGANQFVTYSSEQRAAWEAAAQSELDSFRPAFELALSTEPALAKKYPATAKYLGAKSVIAKRAAGTRKAKLVAKAKQAGSTAAPSAPAANAVPPPATSKGSAGLN